MKTIYQVFNEMVESIGQAEGCCSQLVHMSGHPGQFMVIRDTLSLVKEGAVKIAPHNVLMKPRIVKV